MNKYTKLWRDNSTFANILIDIHTAILEPMVLVAYIMLSDWQNINTVNCNVHILCSFIVLNKQIMMIGKMHFC